MTLDEKIEGVYAAKNLAVYLDVAPSSCVSGLLQFVKTALKNPLCALASTCASSEEAYGEEYFHNMHLRQTGDLSAKYKAMGLETKREQDAYRFVLAMQSHLRVYSKEQETVTGEGLNGMLLLAAQEAVESVVYEYRSLRNDQVSIDPDFAETASKWLSRKIQLKLDHAEKVKLFDSVSISRKDNTKLLIEKQTNGGN